jgi:hypothetical protein
MFYSKIQGFRTFKVSGFLSKVCASECFYVTISFVSGSVLFWKFIGSGTLFLKCVMCHFSFNGIFCVVYLCIYIFQFIQIQDDCSKCSKLDKIHFPYCLRDNNISGSKFLVHLASVVHWKIL